MSKFTLRLMTLFLIVRMPAETLEMPDRIEDEVSGLIYDSTTIWVTPDGGKTWIRLKRTERPDRFQFVP